MPLQTSAGSLNVSLWVNLKKTVLLFNKLFKFTSYLSDTVTKQRKR